MSLRHARLETAYSHGQSHLLADDDHDHDHDKLLNHHPTRRTKRKSTIVTALMVCLLGCFLCFISTFQVLRELTIIIQWTTTTQEEGLAVVSSSSLLQQPEDDVDLPEATTIIADNNNDSDHHAAHLAAAAKDSTVTSSVHRTQQEATAAAATTSATSRQRSPPWVIFYNIYLRPNSTQAGLQSTLRILQDQLDQIGHSFAVTSTTATAAARNNNYNNNNNHHNNNNNSTIGMMDLYYNTIGASDLVDENSASQSFFQELCRRNHLNCLHLKHYEEGYETRTLAEAFKYCQRQRKPQQEENDDDDDDDRTVVIYLHNKGSFHDAQALHQDYHPNHHYDQSSSRSSSNNNTSTTKTAGAYAGQDSWRRAMTAAATSRQCLEQLIIPEKDKNADDKNNENSICDACGLLFQPLPYEHYPGNMWAARCSYLARLVNPLTALRTVRADLMQDLFQTSTQRQLLLLQQKALQKRQAATAAAEGALLSSSSTPAAPILPLPLFQANLFPLANAMTGGDRYLSEFWLGSHPWLRPCDLSKTISLQYWKDHPYPIIVPLPAAAAAPPLLLHPPDNGDDSSWQLFHGPRAAIDNVGWEYHKYRNPNTSDLLLVSQHGNNGGNGSMDSIDDHHHHHAAATNTRTSTSSSLQQELRQYQEFFLLPGRLLKWMYFYNATPRQDSWIWSWFPQGQEWKEQIIGTTTTTAADAANDDGRHSVATTSITTMTGNTLEQHHNQTMHRFQQYYQRVMNARSTLDTIML
jgi:hypothetical protein